MRIVFTSCCDPLHDCKQLAWNEVRSLAPQHIVLLGDNIYMDYKFSKHHLNAKQVRALKPADFARKMHQSYASQWAVASFRAAIAGARVHAIWDDHDFAWNNSRGAGDDDGDTYVPADRRHISRALFQQFREALVAAKSEDYPAYGLAQATNLRDLGGIYTYVDLAQDLRLHLLDGRSFRQRTGEMLGVEQRSCIAHAWLPAPGLNLVASGVTLKEEWSAFNDLAWLREQARAHRILVLSGDIHEVRFSDEYGIPEATASAMAQPKFSWWHKKRTNAFGVLDVEPQRLVISLRASDKELVRREIDRVDWPY